MTQLTVSKHWRKHHMPLSPHYFAVCRAFGLLSSRVPCFLSPEVLRACVSGVNDVVFLSRLSAQLKSIAHRRRWWSLCPVVHSTSCGLITTNVIGSRHTDPKASRSASFIPKFRKPITFLCRIVSCLKTQQNLKMDLLPITSRGYRNKLERLDKTKQANYQTV